MRFDAEPELGWMALQYAARKLDSADIAAFEERMSDDLAACEAVAQAVELAHVTVFLHADFSADAAGAIAATSVGIAPASAPASQAKTQESPQNEIVQPVVAATHAASSWPRTGPLGWLAIGLAAGLAIVAGPLLWNRPVAPGPAVANEVVRDQISNVWADLMSEPITALETGAVAAEEVVADQATALHDVARDAEENLSIDWILNGLRESESELDFSNPPGELN